MTNYEKRTNKIEQLKNNIADDGRFGKIFEIENARKGSRKTTVASVNEKDGTAKFKINGKIHYISVEFKTNGGRVEDIEKSPYVVYRLDICNSSTSGIRRYISPVIIPSTVFMDFLRENKLIKAVNKGGKLDGYGIQASSKKLYLALLDWCIPYDKDTIYTPDDFEGLTL